MWGCGVTYGEECICKQFSLECFQKTWYEWFDHYIAYVSEATMSTISSADMKKIHRLMTPREDGSFLVPEPIVKLWKDVANGGRDEVKKLWMTVGGDKELYWLQHFFSSTHQLAPWPFPVLRSLLPFSRSNSFRNARGGLSPFQSRTCGWMALTWVRRLCKMRGLMRDLASFSFCIIRILETCNTYSWNLHFPAILPTTMSRSRINAIKNECKKNAGWIRLLRRNQLLAMQQFDKHA